MRFSLLQNKENIIQWSHQLLRQLELLVKPYYNGTITLTENVTSTTVSDGGVFIGDKVFLFPQTANAAAAQATTFIVDTDINDGTFIITHANAATTDRTFSYLITTKNEFVS